MTISLNLEKKNCQEIISCLKKLRGHLAEVKYCFATKLFFFFLEGSHELTFAFHINFAFLYLPGPRFVSFESNVHLHQHFGIWGIPPIQNA